MSVQASRPTWAFPRTLTCWKACRIVRGVRPIGSIPVAPPFRLDNHDLALVLCQVRFSTVLRIRQEDAIVGFQDAIREEYPRYSSRHAVQFVLTPDGVQEQLAPDPQHRFDDSSGTYSVVLAPEFLALETRSYRGIDEFADRVAKLAAAVQKHFRPVELERVGLRFINELRLSSATSREAWDEVSEIIAPALLGASGDDALQGTVESSEHVLRLQGDGSDRIIVQHGLHMQGTTVPSNSVSQVSVADQARPFYLLDIDAFDDAPRPFAVPEITEAVQAFNADIRSFFAWGVAERHRTKKLGQRPS